MKKLVSSLVMATLLFSGISVVAAADTGADSTVAHSKAEKKEESRAKLNAKAAKWGVETTDQTNKEVKVAIQEAKAAKKAENAEKKAAKEAKKQEQLENLKEKAAKWGVDTAGKNAKEIKVEIETKKAEKKENKK